MYGRAQVYGVLKKSFGHDEFRPAQADILRSVLQGSGTVAVLPTGGGKSLCYQLPALLFEGTSLVISPLIALMKDQVDALQARGIPAAALHSHQSMEERLAVEAAFRQGRLKLLYVSPERLAMDRFREACQEVEVPFVAVDEAHCVLRWGHEFREAYLGVRPFLEDQRPRVVGAFTATATPPLREELAAELGLVDPQYFVHGFFRSNLRIQVEKQDSEDARLRRLIQLVRGRGGSAPALIYANTRQACEDAALALNRAGLNASAYHAGLEGEERSQAQEDFLHDRLDALIATNAFGMGIDKPDIRVLIHYTLPRSFEDYYQEFGRAGRDGEPSRVHLLWRGSDYRRNSFMAEQSDSSEAAAAALARLSRIYEAVRSPRCLWKRILEYFGDPHAAQLVGGCGACHGCESPQPEAQPLSGSERKHRREILRAMMSLNGRFGRRKWVGLLKGSRAKGVPTWPDAYGALRELTVAQIEDHLQALVDEGQLEVDCGQYPTLSVSVMAADEMA